MRKIAYIIFIVLVLSGCSVLRKNVRKSPAAGINGRSVVLDGLVKNNITAGNFTIAKMDVIISSGDGRERFTANMKYEFPGKYLISIRSIGNLEVARVFLTRDTVLVNDRINRVVYYGEPENFSRKFGINYDLLPVIFGDYVNENRQSEYRIECNDGKGIIQSYIGGMKLVYTADCNKQKIIEADQAGSAGSNVTEIRYDDFVKSDDILVPSLIVLKHLKSETSLELHIGKIQRSIDGPIEFIPGNRYKIRELK